MENNIFLYLQGEKISWFVFIHYTLFYESVSHDMTHTFKNTIILSSISLIAFRLKMKSIASNYHDKS